MSDCSLRARLVLWTLLCGVLIFGAGGVFWYKGQQDRLQAAFDVGLQQYSEQLAWTLAERVAFVPAVECAIPASATSLGGGAQGLAFYSPDDRLICTVGDYPEEGSLPDDGSPFATVVSALEPLRIFSLPVKDDTRLRVARSLRPLEDELQALRLRIATWLALSLAVLGAAQWFYLGRQIAPLRQLAGRFRETCGANMGARLKIAGASPEIMELQDSFNDMLDRMEQSVVRTMQFSAVASHELRTPLTILRGEIEIALRRSDLDEEMQALFASNLEEIARMSRIIEDLLLLSKSDIGEMPLRSEALELNELLIELFGQAAVLGEEKDINVSFYPAEEQIEFIGDSLRLRQLFLNLLSNAIKYTPGGGAVKMTLHQQGNDALVSISDTGIGIAPEHLPHIFERFYRVDKVKNSGDGGSGLGLSIVEWVAEAHGGTISVSSELGKGSEFVVRLPLPKS